MKCIKCGMDASIASEMEDYGAYEFYCKACWGKERDKEDNETPDVKDTGKTVGSMAFRICLLGVALYALGKVVGIL